MKRSAETNNFTDGLGSSASGRNHVKRPKSSQACSSCRKHKTRCEVLDASISTPYRCHRCKVLNISCSFESSDLTPLRDPTPAPSTSTSQYQATYSHEPERPLALRQSDSPLSHNQSAKPEDLFPLPLNNTPWGFVRVPGGFDWTATPMLAMQKFTSRSQLGDDPAVLDVAASLSRILSPARITSLLNIFESLYYPWLNLQPYHSNSSLLTLARCTVASRHLDSVTRSAVVPQLQKLTEDAILKHVFNPVPSTESIEAVLTLSLWSSVGGPVYDAVRDGRLLIASGVSMATNLRLSQAVAYAASLRDEIKKRKMSSDPNTSDLDDAMEKARLWLCLMNVESMLCLGTGRSPLSHRTPMDHTVIHSSSSDTVESGRDMRLSLMGQIFEVAELGLRLKLSSKLAIGKFYQEVIGVLMKFDNVLRLISPLPVVVEHEIAYFHILKLYHHSCRLLFLHNTIRALRNVVQTNSDRHWFNEAEHDGVNVVKLWGHQAILLAEEILSLAISQPELEQLGTAPDNVFSLLCFAAVFLIICKYSVHQLHGHHLSGSSDVLLAKFTDRLSRVACGADHAPAKCVQLLSAMMDTFKARTTKGGGDSEHEKTQNAELGMALEVPSESTIEHVPHREELPRVQQSHNDISWPSLDSGVDLDQLMNPDIILDSEFWASFMDSITTDTM